jgi:hypothetical protein
MHQNGSQKPAPSMKQPVQKNNNNNETLRNSEISYFGAVIA